MRSSKRDLLVLSKKDPNNQKEMELEVEKLHELLFLAESIENFCLVSEIIDINRYKIIEEPLKMQRMLLKKKLKPFQFVNNKN